MAYKYSYPTSNPPYMRVSENRGPEYSSLNSRILVIKDPKLK